MGAGLSASVGTFGRGMDYGMAAHFALTVPDIKAAYERAVERGADGGKQPRFGLDKRWQFNMFDPDGTRAECMQPESSDGKP